MRILIAEDDGIARLILETQLDRWGHDVVVTRDGTEAWKVLESGDSPQLAILDWRMPGVDGLELCRRVRAGGKESYTYLLLLTARSGEENLLQAMEAGANDYLTKPFSADELRVRLLAGERFIQMENERKQPIDEPGDAA